uniref:Uncharacterized protein n=1 Tax=Anguilla anguilla TaxID=7936 RepID=A0A0E9QNA6_ANGAN
MDKKGSCQRSDQEATFCTSPIFSSLGERLDRRHF